MSSADVLNKAETVTCKIEWKLNDLHTYREFMPNEKCFSSKMFYNSQYRSAAWELRVYLYSSNNYATLVQVKQTLKVKYELYALDARGERVDLCPERVMSHDFNRFKETWRHKLDMERLAHTDGSVLLVCEIKFLPQNLKRSQKLKCGFKDISNFSSTNFQKLMSNMFEQETLTDCVINGEINIADSSHECFLALLKYFYSGEVDKVSLEKFPEELFAIAEKYQVLPLKEVCERFMASGIDAKNFGKRYLYAGVHGLPLVERACVDFISANRKKFLASNEWKEFEAEYKEMADHLLISVAYDGNIA
uniref:BTB domain-containing protein n=1 Tax=Meloidogyne javanica TaxID=6303 RepID=A0A915MCV1_MELJA